MNSLQDNGRFTNQISLEKNVHSIWDRLLQQNERSSSLNISSSINQMNEAIDYSMNRTRDLYHWIMTFEDPRVADWPLVSHPSLVLILFSAYLLAANYGPTLMSKRKPFELRGLIIAYNLSVALLNLWIACEIIYCSYMLNYKSLCLLVHIDREPHVMRIANAIWWYFASKGIEFADTLFFILRKRERQLTFLHKYHHSSMFLVWWTAVKFVPGGSVVVPIVVNSLVHVLMYTYYALSAIGPQMRKYLWWKRHLTTIQLIQFFIGVSIGIHLITSDCQFTRWMQYVFSGYTLSFIFLFGNFYLNEYIKGRSKKIN